MKIDILTIFPEMFKGVFSASMLKIAQEKNIVKIKVHDIRDYADNKHRKVDDKPYGGGAGMVMGAGPIYRTLCSLKTKSKSDKPKIILLSPRGKKFDNNMAKKLSSHKHIILICGHYEGVDQRITELFSCEEISIGDYILTGGELPAMVVVDALVRFKKGALGNKSSVVSETFEKNLLEYDQYTRPAEFMGLKVPEVLLSGDHKKIAKWRSDESLKETKKNRPDLYKKIKH